MYYPDSDTPSAATHSLALVTSDASDTPSADTHSLALVTSDESGTLSAAPHSLAVVASDASVASVASDAADGAGAAYRALARMPADGEVCFGYLLSLLLQPHCHVQVTASASS